ncbi:MAG: glycosyl transferase [Rhodococcus sp.]|nr:glycosyl transferase [Rhodococcus sp. (in: high G+C Gram-positive bacteria)]
MRVAIVAGPDAGHAIPAIALALRFRDAGDAPVVFTGSRWLDVCSKNGIDARLLPGLTPRAHDDDLDAGARIHARAAHIATELLPELAAVSADLVVADVLTVGGAMAAEQLGVPWIELSPHPLYAPSKGLPPIGTGLAPGVGLGGRIRDALLRASTGRSLKKGRIQRAAARASIGLPVQETPPIARLIATLPALEVPRPDWPDDAYVVGPLLWEPTEQVLGAPPGDAPLVMIAPSTAVTGAAGMLESAIEGLAGADVRVVASVLDERPAALRDGTAADWVRAGLGRQDVMLAQAVVAVCGGGHGMLAKALLHGVPVVVVPGGGDQWELANRAVRQGSAVIVRPPSPDSLRQAVETVLTDPSYAAAAQAAARSAGQVMDPVQVCHDALARATSATVEQCD